MSTRILAGDRGRSRSRAHDRHLERAMRRAEHFTLTVVGIATGFVVVHAIATLISVGYQP